jgi:hypothetical protein
VCHGRPFGQQAKGGAVCRGQESKERFIDVADAVWWRCGRWRWEDSESREVPVEFGLVEVYIAFHVVQDRSSCWATSTYRAVTQQRRREPNIMPHSSVGA